MKNLPGKQKGASAILTFIVLVLLAYGVYLGIQYVPLAIESRAIDSILTTMKSDQRSEPVTTEQAAKAKVSTLLNINEMNDMAKHLKISQRGGNIIVKFSYEREMNLGYKKHVMQYEKVLELKR